MTLVVALIGAGCRPQPSTSPALSDSDTAPLKLSPRDVATVTTGRVLSGVRVTGTLNPAVSVELKARLSEEVEAVLAHRGTVVTQGQVLARLDNRGPIAELNRIRSQLAAAERDFGAAEVLFKGGAISERAYSNARVSVDSAEAQRLEAEQTVDHTMVKSPIDGVVSDRAVSVGESVSPGQRLFTVVNSENLECTVAVLPSDVMNIRLGQRAQLNLTAYGGMTLQGHVERIDPLADPQSRRVGVHILIPNADKSVVAGLFCTGTVLTNETSADRLALFIPSGAVRLENGETVVYGIRDRRLRRIAVSAEVDENTEGLVEVRSGLTAGEVVVLSSNQELSENEPVVLPEKDGEAP